MSSELWEKIGLHVHPEKTQYISNHPPIRCKNLPGTNMTGQGMIILAQLFDLQETTQADPFWKEGAAWSQYRRILPVLKQKTSIRHRFRILQACILQKLMWASESWVLTKRRLQHLRAAHTKMLKGMIPVPSLLQTRLDLGEKIVGHTRHVREPLKQHGFLSLDELVAKKTLALGRPCCETHEIHHWMTHKGVAWWKRQQSNSQEMRCVASDANLSRWEDALVRYAPNSYRWKEDTRLRDRWQRKFPDFGRISAGLRSAAPKAPITGLVLEECFHKWQT